MFKSLALVSQEMERLNLLQLSIFLVQLPDRLNPIA
jgi:hypothetical protein